MSDHTQACPEPPMGSSNRRAHAIQSNGNMCPAMRRSLLLELCISAVAFRLTLTASSGVSGASHARQSSSTSSCQPGAESSGINQAAAEQRNMAGWMGRKVPRQTRKYSSLLFSIAAVDAKQETRGSSSEAINVVRWVSRVAPLAFQG